MATIGEALDLARQHLVAGALPQAEHIYRQILAVEPNHPDALHLLGVIARQMDRDDLALDLIGRALVQRPDFPEAHNNLGGCLQRQGRLEEAIASYRMAVAQKPDFRIAHANLGDALRELGNALNDRDLLAEAEASWRRVVSLAPEWAEAHNSLGDTLQYLGRYDDATACYRMAIARKADYAEAFNGLGAALYRLGRIEEAVEQLNAAIALAPDYAGAHANLGSALYQLGLLDQASERFGTALSLQPNLVEAHINQGLINKALGRIDQAIENYNMALSIDPHSADARMNRAYAYLAGGRLRPAWIDHEWRWKSTMQHFKRPFPQPWWDGRPLDGALLIWGEQGLGDEMIGASMLPDALAAAGECIVECDPRLVALFARSFPAATVVPRQTPPDPRTLAARSQIPLLGLARFHRNDSSEFPTHAGHLVPDPARVAHWRAWLDGLGCGSKVGLSWKSRIVKRQDSASFPSLDQLAVILRVPGVVFINLQYDDTAADIAAMVRHSGVQVHTPPDTDLTNDIDEVAALTACLDAVVGPTAAPVVLAGALGRPAWMFAHFQATWEMAIQPWSPTIRVEHHRFGDDWTDTLTRVATHLVRLAGAPFEFAAAVAHHQAGRSGEAEAAYRQILTLNPDHAEAHSNLGLVLLTRGRLDEAEATCRRAIAVTPEFVMAHANLGNVLRELGRLEEAEASYRRALVLQPDFDIAHNNLGNILRELGRLEEAEARCRRALEISPDFVVAHINLGRVLHKLGRRDEAEASYRRALHISPDNAEAYTELGTTLCDLGRMNEGETCYRRAVEIAPDLADAHCFRGNILRDLGHPDDAEASCRRALEIRPNFAMAHNNLGNALSDLGRLTEAEACFRRALAIEPDFVMARSNLGCALRSLGRLAEAEETCRLALDIDPDHAEAYNNLGNALHDLGRLDEAVASYGRALELAPDFATVHNNLGNALRDLSRLEEAAACYRRALAITPDYADVYANLARTMRELNRWEEAEASCRRALDIDPDHGDAHSKLLFEMNYSGLHDPSTCVREAVRYGAMVRNKVSARFCSWTCAPHPERLRVGVVSGDLFSHPVGYFLESVLSHLDPGRVEVIAFPNQHSEDEVTRRLRSHCAGWVPLFGLSDQTAALAIHGQGVHVLCDLSGHTGGNRLPVFAWKPAPVQVSWLGYFATTGVAAMDYLLGDPYVLPPGEEHHVTETVWRLPESYLCFTAPALDVGRRVERADACITFGCFNNLCKMNDAVVSLWARVLHAVPGSRLLLKTKLLDDGDMRETIRRRFAAQGIPHDRLVLEGASPRAELLAAYHRVDVALDPFPYPGGTTSVEALWMGVPIITRRGDRFLSHIGETIAHNAGLADWIADNDDDYVAKAVTHTSNRDRLAGVKSDLRRRIGSSPLFDAPRFARHFESAVWGMYCSESTRS